VCVWNFGLKQKMGLMCVCLFVGSFSLEQEKDLAKHCSLLQGVGNFGLKKDHNAT
jgi:hypothetical protein